MATYQAGLGAITMPSGSAGGEDDDLLAQGPPRL